MEDVAVEMSDLRHALHDKGKTESTVNLKREIVGENIVSVQRDEYFGTVGIDADAEDDEDVVIRLDNVHKTYLLGIEGVAALRGVSMSVSKGEFVCIFGTSGGGKTTMLNVIGTIDKPTRGYVYLCGRRVGNHTADKELSDLRLNKIGFVFQTFNLLSSLTALENVEMPMTLAGRLTASQRRERAVHLLTQVGMEKRLHHVPAQLSGGEQQRVTIARAIANNPDILLLDEPTGDLDSASSSLVLSLLSKLNKEEGITLVLVTHDLNIKYLADRVLWMRDGKLQRVEIVSTSKREEAYANLERECVNIRATNNAANVESNDNNNNEEKGNRWKNTTVRKPDAYAYFRGKQAFK